LCAENEYGAVPPLALNVTGPYRTPTVPDGSTAGAEIVVVVMMRVRVTVMLAFEESVTVNWGLEAPTGVKMEGFPVNTPLGLITKVRANASYLTRALNSVACAGDARGSWRFVLFAARSSSQLH
jgi:hypothetical protein